MHEENAKVGEVDCNLRTFKMNRIDHIFLLESRQQHKAIDIADRSTSSASIIKVAWRWCFIVFTFFRARWRQRATFYGKIRCIWRWLERLLHDTKTLVQWPWLELTLLHLMLELAPTCEWAKKDGKENESNKQTSWPIYFYSIWSAQQSSHAFATRTTPHTPHPLWAYIRCVSTVSSSARLTSCEWRARMENTLSIDLCRNHAIVTLEVLCVKFEELFFPLAIFHRFLLACFPSCMAAECKHNRKTHTSSHQAQPKVASSLNGDVCDVCRKKMKFRIS